jgi:hypothetical protein
VQRHHHARELPEGTLKMLCDTDVLAGESVTPDGCYTVVPNAVRNKVLSESGGDAMSTVSLVFIGERFYKESQTLMGNIYRKHPDGKWSRYDWGALQLDINAGKVIEIRPATDKEIKFFDGKLNETLVKWGYQPGLAAQVHNVGADNAPDFWYAVMSLSKPFAGDEEQTFEGEP